MKIVCIGAGPAGPYFAILMKKLDPAHDVTVYERNRADDTFGWGVVFSDQTLENMSGADEASKREIIASFTHWDDIDVHIGGRVIRSGGHAFCGIERRHLLQILQRRAQLAGAPRALAGTAGRRLGRHDATFMTPPSRPHPHGAAISRAPPPGVHPPAGRTPRPRGAAGAAASA